MWYYYSINDYNYNSAARQREDYVRIKLSCYWFGIAVTDDDCLSASNGRIWGGYSSVQLNSESLTEIQNTLPGNRIGRNDLSQCPLPLSFSAPHGMTQKVTTDHSFSDSFTIQLIQGPVHAIIQSLSRMDVKYSINYAFRTQSPQRVNIWRKTTQGDHNLMATVGCKFQSKDTRWNIHPLFFSPIVVMHVDLD